MGMTRAVHVAVAVVLAVALAACSGGGEQARGPSRHSPTTTSASKAPGARAGALAARIELSSRRVAGGTTLAGTVVVNNLTGHVVEAVGCISVFGVVLTNDSVPPEPAWLACRQTFSIPEGKSRYPVVVSASFASCTQGDPSSPTACRPGTGSRPLPPGRYRAVLVQSQPVVPAAKPVAVTVV
jgi:hypothetical protein